jgi:hypothetical protein
MDAECALLKGETKTLLLQEWSIQLQIKLHGIVKKLKAVNGSAKKWVIAATAVIPDNILDYCIHTSHSK